MADVHEDYITNCTQNTNGELAEVKLKCKKLQDEVNKKSKIIATMERKNHDAEGKRTEKVGKTSPRISKGTQLSNISQRERNIERRNFKEGKRIGTSK